MLRELSESLNFTIPDVIWGDSYGAWNSETSSWTGVIGKLEQNQADMGVSEFRMTNERLNAIDYTVPIAVGGAQLYSRKLDSARLQWNAYFKVQCNSDYSIFYSRKVNINFYFNNFFHFWFSNKPRSII